MGIGPFEGVQIALPAQRAVGNEVAFFLDIIARTPPVITNAGILAHARRVCDVHPPHVVTQKIGQGILADTEVPGHRLPHRGSVVDLRRHPVHRLVHHGPTHTRFTAKLHKLISPFLQDHSGNQPLLIPSTLSARSTSC